MHSPIVPMCAFLTPCTCSGVCSLILSISDACMEYLANLSSLTRAVDLHLTVCSSVVLQVVALQRHPLTWTEHQSNA